MLRSATSPSSSSLPVIRIAAVGRGLALNSRVGTPAGARVGTTPFAVTFHGPLPGPSANILPLTVSVSAVGLQADVIR